MHCWELNCFVVISQGVCSVFFMPYGPAFVFPLLFRALSKRKKHQTTPLGNEPAFSTFHTLISMRGVEQLYRCLERVKHNWKYEGFRSQLSPDYMLYIIFVVSQFQYISRALERYRTLCYNQGSWRRSAAGLSTAITPCCKSTELNLMNLVSAAHDFVAVCSSLQLL